MCFCTEASATPCLITITFCCTITCFSVLAPVRKRFASKGQGLGRLRSSDTYAYEMFEDSTEASGTEQLDFINEEYVTDGNYDTLSPASL